MAISPRIRVDSSGRKTNVLGVILILPPLTSESGPFARFALNVPRDGLPETRVSLSYRLAIRESEAVRVGIYTRISRDDGRQAVGVARQERLCRNYASERGWQVFAVYCDNDRSASSYARLGRPAFDRLLAGLRAQHFDRVLVLAQDRLVRRPEQLEDIMRLLSATCSAGVESVLGGPLDAGTSHGRIQARIKVVFDAAYADFVSERVTLAKRARAERGLPPGGGARPFGYRSGGMLVEPSEAALIREAAARVLSGEPLYAICADWARRDIRSAQGVAWRSGVLRKVLEAPRLAGLREYRNEIVGQAAWPAILDEQTHANLRAVFRDANRRNGGRPPVQVHLLSGIAQCGRCRRTLLSNVVKGARYYVCRTAPAKGGCGRLGMKAAPVEEHVIATLFDTLAQLNVYRALDSGQIALRRQIEADRDALDALAIRRYLARDITRREHEAARTKLLARVDSAELEFLMLKHRGRDLSIDRQRWGLLPRADQRGFLREHIAELIIKPAVRCRGRI